MIERVKNGYGVFFDRARNELRRTINEAWKSSGIRTRKAFLKQIAKHKRINT